MELESFDMCESFEASIFLKIKDTLKNMESEWNLLDLSKELQERRARAALQCISEMCDKLLGEEKAMRERINQRIYDHELKVKDLCKDLQIEFEEPNNMSLLKYDTFLKDKVAELKEKREERFRILRELLEEDKRLCHYLAESPYSISANLLPSNDDLQQIRNHIQEMKIEMNRRAKTYNSLRDDIIKFSEQIGKSFDSDILLDIVRNPTCETCMSSAYIQDIKKLHCDLEFLAKELETESIELREKVSSLWELLKIEDDKRSTFLATVVEHTPSSVKKLQEELSLLKELRSQNLSRFVNDLKAELQIWWGKCYVGEDTMQSFLHANSEVSEGVLDAFEGELNKWKKYHQNHFYILDKVDYFLNLFDNMQQLEEKAKDPARLFNSRGGALLQEEKERRKVKSELPLVQTRLIELGAEYEAKNGVQLLIEGKSIEDYLSYLWNFHEHQREQEKNRLHNKNKNQSSTKKLLKSTPSVIPKNATRKRARDVDDAVTSVIQKKIAKGPVMLSGPTMFKSPLKSLKATIQASASLPKVRQLTDRKHHIPPPFSSHNNDDTFMQTPAVFTYDKFKAAVDDMHTKEIIHSSIHQEESNKYFLFEKEEYREKYLKDSLNLASPSKGILPKILKHGSPIPGGAAGGAYLKRSLSYSSINNSPKFLRPRKLWLP